MTYRRYKLKALGIPIKQRRWIMKWVNKYYCGIIPPHYQPGRKKILELYVEDLPPERKMAPPDWIKIDDQWKRIEQPPPAEASANATA